MGLGSKRRNSKPRKSKRRNYKSPKKNAENSNRRKFSLMILAEKTLLWSHFSTLHTYYNSQSTSLFSRPKTALE